MPYISAPIPFHRPDPQYTFGTSPPKFQCTCYQIFPDQATLDSHVRNSNPILSSNEICALCYATVSPHWQHGHDRFHKLYGWHGGYCKSFAGLDCDCGLEMIQDVTW